MLAARAVCVPQQSAYRYTVANRGTLIPLGTLRAPLRLSAITSLAHILVLCCVSPPVSSMPGIHSHTAPTNQGWGDPLPGEPWGLPDPTLQGTAVVSIVDSGDLAPLNVLERLSFRIHAPDLEAPVVEPANPITVRYLQHLHIFDLICCALVDPLPRTARGRDTLEGVSSIRCGFLSAQRVPRTSLGCPPFHPHILWSAALPRRRATCRPTVACVRERCMGHRGRSRGE